VSTPVADGTPPGRDAEHASLFPSLFHAPIGDLGVRLIAPAGRCIVVWLAVAVICASERPLSASGLMGVSLAAGVWLFSLRTPFAGGVQYALGPAVAAAVGTSTGLVVVAALNPLVPGLQVSIPALLGMALGVFASVAVWERAIGRTAAKRRVLVIGTSGFAEIAAEAHRGRRMPLDVIGASESDRRQALSQVPLLGAPDDLASIVQAQRPSFIVLTDDETCPAALDRLLDLADRRFRVASLTSFFEYAFGRVPLSHLTPMWFMSILHLRQRVYSRWSKRAFDLVVAGVGLAVAAPLFPLIALAIRRTRGPVMYRQTRVGEGGRSFTMLKFRTMVEGAEHPGRPVYARDCDSRATGIGRFLRGTHLDELPQLWNVLKGDMSIVGPRPERPEFIAMLEAGVPFWSRRLLIKPGVTGWAQVHCGYACDCESAAEKLSYDFWYLRHGNMAVDLAVCVRTVLLVLCHLLSRRVWERQRRAHAQG